MGRSFRRSRLGDSPAGRAARVRSPWSMRAATCAATAGLARKATPRPAACSIGRSLAPSPTVIVCSAESSRSAARRSQRGELGLLAQDRRLDGAGKRHAVVGQHVCAVGIEAQRPAHHRGEIGEAAGDQRTVRAVLLHGGDQCGAARRVADASGGLVELRHRKALQQPDPLLERAGEIDLAVHGAGGDGGDPVAQAEELGQLVQHLVLDHGRFHVGHQQLLAPARGGNDDGIDRRHGDGRGVAVERQVAGDLGIQPVGRPDGGALGAQHIDGVADGAVVQGGMGRARDQDQDVFHVPALAAASWICKQFARHGGTARPRRHRPDGQRQIRPCPGARRTPAGHGDQRRRHADLRCLPHPHRAARRGGAGARAASPLRHPAAVARPCRPRAGERWRRRRSSAAWPKAGCPSCAAARVSTSGR